MWPGEMMVKGAPYRVNAARGLLNNRRNAASCPALALHGKHNVLRRC